MGQLKWKCHAQPWRWSIIWWVVTIALMQYRQKVHSDNTLWGRNTTSSNAHRLFLRRSTFSEPVLAWELGPVMCDHTSDAANTWCSKQITQQARQALIRPAQQQQTCVLSPCTYEQDTYNLNSCTRGRTKMSYEKWGLPTFDTLPTLLGQPSVFL